VIFRRTKGRTSLISGDSTAGERTLPKGRPERAQRYRCRVCRKTSNALIGAPMTSLRHKEKWLVYVEGLKDGMPVRSDGAAASYDDLLVAAPVSDQDQGRERHDLPRDCGVR
jgi:hypothetical protein